MTYLAKLSLSLCLLCGICAGSLDLEPHHAIALALCSCFAVCVVFGERV